MTWQIYKPGLTIVLLLVTLSSTNQGGSAVLRFQTLQESLRRSRDGHDWHSYVNSARELKEFVNESPDSLLEVTRAEIRVGELAEAMRNVQEFTRMGQSTDLLETSTEFAPLRKQSGFAGIQRIMKANRTSIGHASTDFLLSDSNLLAEDLDYDPQANQFLVTAFGRRKSFRL